VHVSYQYGFDIGGADAFDCGCPGRESDTQCSRGNPATEAGTNVECLCVSVTTDEPFENRSW
jgi:hypothetical protein